MTVGLYMDVHVHRAITDGLRVHGVDILTAQEDGAAELPDSDLLDRATALGRVLFTYDDDFLRQASRRQERGIAFAGIIYVHQRDVRIGQCIDNLEVLAQCGEAGDFANKVEYLPI